MEVCLPESECPIATEMSLTCYWHSVDIGKNGSLSLSPTQLAYSVKYKTGGMWMILSSL